MFHSKYSYEYLSMFRVQIPVDACPLFGLKRRSFLFVIDIQNAVSITAFFTCTPTDSIPVADAIGAKRNNRYYARVARYEPFGCARRKQRKLLTVTP